MSENRENKPCGGEMILKKTVSLTLVVTIMVMMMSYSLANEITEEFNEGEGISVQIAYPQDAPPPKVSARAAIAVDALTGRILFEKNAHTRMEMASTTKIMTAIVAIENGKLDDVVTVSAKAAGVWGSKIALKKGDRMTLRNLLYGLMLKSGNDAAIAIAEHIGGSVDEFCKLMNKKAVEIGAVNTCFKSPHGLDMPGHYSTAYDLALMTRYAIKNPVFNDIVRTVNITVQGARGNINMNNTNEMLRLYPGADGIKTGYTGKAGRCLVASATKNGWRAISVVLGCSSRNVRASDSSRILNYSFSNYKLQNLIRKGDSIGSVYVHKGLESYSDVIASDTVEYVLSSDETDRVEAEYLIPDRIAAPVDAGQKIGEIVFRLDGKIIGKTDAISNKSIGRKDFWYYIGRIYQSAF